MTLWKFLNLDISNIAEIFSNGKRTNVVKNNTVPSELYCTSNSNPLIDKADMNTNKKRSANENVKIAIQRFNNLTKEEKLEILEKADGILHDKLNEFIERSFHYEQACSDISNSFNHIYQISNRLRSYVYDENEMDAIYSELKKTIKKCYNNIEYFSETFLQYRGHDILNDKNISLSDKANYAVTKSNNLRQTILSYEKRIASKFREIHKTTVGKSDVMCEIETTAAKIQTIIETFQNDCTDMMNDYILEAVVEENKFNKDMTKYAEDNIPTEFSLENKVIENAILDAIVNALNYKGADIC